MHVGGPLLCIYHRSAPAPVAELPFLLHVPPSKKTSYGMIAALLVGARVLGTINSSPARMGRRANRQASCLPQCLQREVSHSQFARDSWVDSGWGHQLGDTTIHRAGVLSACIVAMFLPVSTATLTHTVAPLRARRGASRVPFVP